MALIPAIWEPTAFAILQYRLMLVYGLFFGGLLLMAAYHTLLAVSTGDHIYLFYAL